MPLTAEKIRLRVPLDPDMAEELVGRPRKLRKAQMAQPVLLPEHPLPLRVGWWPDTPDHVQDALRRATEIWNHRLKKRAGIGPAFMLVDFDYLGSKDLMVGCRDFEPLDGKTQFGASTVGGFGVHGDTSTSPQGKGEELGDCELFWNLSRKVIAGRIFIPDDLSKFDSVCVLAHELGHGLLLGHDPVHPWRLMYKDHTGVRGPKPKECRWVQEIWT